MLPLNSNSLCVLGFSHDCTSFPPACVCAALLLKGSGRVRNPETKWQDLAHAHIAWGYILLWRSSLVPTLQPRVSSRPCGGPMTGCFFSVSKLLMVNTVLQFTKAVISISWTWAFVSQTPWCSTESMWGYFRVQSLMNHGKRLVGRGRDQLAQTFAQSRSNFKVGSVLKILHSQAVSVSMEGDFTDLCGQYVPANNHPHGELILLLRSYLECKVPQIHTALLGAVFGVNCHWNNSPGHCHEEN